MFNILREFLPYLSNFQGDTSAYLINLIGGLLIGLVFIVIGVICISMTRIVPTENRRRNILTMLFGYSLVVCGLSRFIGVVCIWHNLAILDGWIKIITGLLMASTFIYVPSLIRAAIEAKHLSETRKSLEDTKKSLTEIKNISDRLTKD